MNIEEQIAALMLELKKKKRIANISLTLLFSICGTSLFSLLLFFFLNLLFIFKNAVNLFYLPTIFLGMLLFFGAGAIGGVHLFCYRSNAVRAIQLLNALMEEKKRSCSFERLAEIWNVKLRKVEHILRTLQNKAYLGNIRVDYQKQMVSPLLTVSSSETAEAPRENPQQTNDAETVAMPHLRHLREILSHMLSAEDATFTQRLIDDTDLLLDNARKDPRDIQDTAGFLRRFLPLGEKLAARLPDLLPEQDELRKKIYASLQQLHVAFQKEMTLMLENDRLDVEAEASVLNQLLHNNGLADSGLSMPLSEENQDTLSI